MTSERRRKERTKLREICYIQIDSDNGGVVLDLSEDGLSFQAAGPVHETGPVRFSFLSFLKGRIDASGELVWTNPDRKAGGVRFTDLPAATRAYVGELLGNPIETPVIEAEPVIAEDISNFLNTEPLASENSAEDARDASAKEVQPPSRPDVSSAPSAASIFASHSLLGYQEVAEPSAPVPGEPRLPGRHAFLRGFLTGVAITALAAAGLWSFENYQRQLGDIVARVEQGSFSAEKSVPPPPPPPSATEATPTAASGATSDIPPSSSASAPSNSNLSSSVVQSAAQPSAPPSSGASPSTPPPGEPFSAPPPPREATKVQVPEIEPPETGPILPGDTGRAELITAERFLRDKDARNVPSAEQWLWAAVRKGNTQAEVELSDLYLKGDGVKQNCEQARILLLAAAKKGSAAAKQKLQTVDKIACRS